MSGCGSMVLEFKNELQTCKLFYIFANECYYRLPQLNYILFPASCQYHWLKAINKNNP